MSVAKVHRWHEAGDVTRLVRALESNDAEVVDSATTALVELEVAHDQFWSRSQHIRDGSKEVCAVRLLEQAAQSADQRIRAHALLLLCADGDLRCTSLLATNLATPTSSRVAESCHALRFVKSVKKPAYFEALCSPLRSLLASPTSEELARASAAWTFGVLGGAESLVEAQRHQKQGALPNAIDILLPYLSFPSALVRRGTIEGLRGARGMSTEAAWAALKTFVSDSCLRVTKASAQEAVAIAGAEAELRRAAFRTMTWIAGEAPRESDIATWGRACLAWQAGPSVARPSDPASLRRTENYVWAIKVLRGELIVEEKYLSLVEGLSDRDINDWDAVLAKANAVLQRFPRSYPALKVKGRALVNLGRIDEGRRATEEATALGPQPSSYFDDGALLDHIKQWATPLRIQPPNPTKYHGDDSISMMAVLLAALALFGVVFVGMPLFGWWTVLYWPLPIIAAIPSGLRTRARFEQRGHRGRWRVGHHYFATGKALAFFVGWSPVAAILFTPAATLTVYWVIHGFREGEWLRPW